MGQLALDLKDTSNCGADFDLGNPIVMDAYNGFITYAPLYQAGCLKASATAEGNTSDSTNDDSSKEYCYVTATADQSSMGDSYIYSLPLGIALPGATRPTCSQCLQKTMAFFATAATNMTSPLSTDYDSAAEEINSGCGPNFVQQSVTPNKSTSGAAALRVQTAAVLAAVTAIGVLLS